MKKLSAEQIAQEEKLRAPKPATGTSKERYVKVTFLIVTEGTKTEPNYLNALKKVLEATNRFNIEISIEGKGKATKALVNKIVRQIENCNQEYDRVWAVFDKDEFDDFDDAISLAGSKNINCAWSNESFELWLLLHFKEVSTPTGRKDLFEELEQAIRNALHKNNPEAVFDLSKGNDRIYELVTSLGSEAEAIRRASALKAMFKGTAKPSEQNPCTRMDLLIHELRHPETIPLSSGTRKENLT